MLKAVIAACLVALVLGAGCSKPSPTPTYPGNTADLTGVAARLGPFYTNSTDAVYIRHIVRSICDTCDLTGRIVYEADFVLHQTGSAAETIHVSGSGFFRVHGRGDFPVDGAARIETRDSPNGTVFTLVNRLDGASAESSAWNDVSFISHYSRVIVGSDPRQTSSPTTGLIPTLAAAD